MAIPQNDRSGPIRQPPPLPPAKPVASGRPVDRAKAFVTIRGLRLAGAARSFAAWARRRPVTAGVIGTVVVLAAGLGVAYSLDAMPELAFLGPRTVADARASARAHPNDADVQRDLGHALWSSHRRHRAVTAYARALALNPGVADEKMTTNLVASFGTKDQREAEALIWKHKLLGAERGLESLVRSKRPAVRWGAVHTLDRLGKGTRSNWETGYVLDLESADCDVRRRAVDKLGTIGTQRAVSALRAAKVQDEKTGGWFRSRCLGDRLDDAEHKILARR
jgi:hypothetical protein